MKTKQGVLDVDILPRVYSSLDSVFPEFGWRRNRGGWVATNGRFTRERFGARPDRVVARMPAGFLIHGDRSYHWLEYVAGGFPRGEAWWSAVTQLGLRVGVNVNRAPASIRARVLECLHQSLDWGGAEIEGYLAARCCAAPSGCFGTFRDAPFNLLRDAGFSKDDIRRANISPDPRWDNRIVSPWRDESGVLQSFWGRSLGDEEPRYLILSGRAPVLFGADVAIRAARTKRPKHGVLVTEGMFDALNLRAHGFDETVATGRAGLTVEALKILESASAVTLLFDADRAGQRGCWWAIENWARQSCPVSLAVAFLPSNVKDPDDLVKQQGPDALRQVLDAREPASVAYCRHLVGTATNSCDLLRAASLAVPFLTAVGVCHPFEVKLATDFLADHGISASQLRLATQQLDSSELQNMRIALNARIAYIDSLL